MNIEEEEGFSSALAKHKGPLILVADEIVPSLFLQIPLERIEGIVCQFGGITSHLAILSKSHNIPALLNVEDLLEIFLIKVPSFWIAHKVSLSLDQAKENKKHTSTI